MTSDDRFTDTLFTEEARVTDPDQLRIINEKLKQLGFEKDELPEAPNE